MIMPNDPTTLADFWLPDSEEDIGDPRQAITQGLVTLKVDIEDAIEVDPNPKCPPSFLGISCGWYHTVDHGPQDEETFREDLQGAIDRFVELISKKYNPFQPIRFYRDANPSYGISPFTFTGDEAPFDLRLIGMVERSIGYEYQGEKIYAPGVKWFLSTMVVPDKERDAEVHVGYDWGSAYDGT